jgi:hypothetical protein
MFQALFGIGEADTGSFRFALGAENPILTREMNGFFICH